MLKTQQLFFIDPVKKNHSQLTSQAAGPSAGKPEAMKQNGSLVVTAYRRHTTGFKMWTFGVLYSLLSPFKGNF